MKKTLLFLFLSLIFNYTFSQNEAELNSKGIQFAKAGNLDKALETFKKIIEINPNSIGANTNIGNIYRIKKDYQSAINYYSKSFEISPNLNVLFSRANTYLDSEQIEKSIIDYTYIIKKDKNFNSIYFDRAYAYIRIKNYEKAKIDLEKQLVLKPNDFKSLANLINVKKLLGQTDSLSNDYAQILKKFPNNENKYILYNNWANLYVELNQLDKALEKINLALKENKKYDLGYLNKGEIYLKLGNIKKACKNYEKALKLNVLQNKHFEADQDYIDLKNACEK